MALFGALYAPPIAAAAPTLATPVASAVAAASDAVVGTTATVATDATGLARRDTDREDSFLSIPKLGMITLEETLSHVHVLLGTPM